MRLRPGVRLGLHRHTGEVHTLDLAGDWWEATGSEELLVYAFVKGSAEYLGAHHSVLQRITTADRMADCRRHCASMGVQPGALT